MSKADRHAAVQLDTLLTERLVLRRFNAGDHDAMAALNADPVVMEHLPGVMMRADTLEGFARIDAHFAAHGFGLWAVEVCGGPQCIGFVGLMRPSFSAPFMPCVEIGWRLARTAWGHGYATEAARAALHAGFTQLGLLEIVSFTVPANVRSRRVMERIGMQRDTSADFDHPRLPEGHPLRRHVLYRIHAGASALS